MITCEHSPWVCFYERTSDGWHMAFCQRCAMSSEWHLSKGEAERNIRFDYDRKWVGAGGVEVFT